MSRIHEALKKAEEQRSATQGGASLPAIAPPGVDDGMAAPQSPVAAMPRTSGPAGSFSLDVQLDRIPQQEWKPDLGTMLFMNGNNNATGAEEYRTLRSRLYHLRERVNLKTLLVTSALPKEGKSFTASNLAQVLVRQHGKRVLLIDADLRGPQLHRLLGAPAGPGLSDYLQGRNDEFSVMQRGQKMENLYFIPSGTGIEDPAELVGNGRLRVLLQRVEPIFDWIIIDSPPAIPVSDAALISKACDGVLLVVRSNSTPADVARKARQEFPEESLVGVVLNGLSGDTASYTRYYYEVYDKKVTAKP